MIIDFLVINLQFNNFTDLSLEQERARKMREESMTLQLLRSMLFNPLLFSPIFLMLFSETEQLAREREVR